MTYLFMVVKYTVSPEWTRPHDMPICQDVPFLSIHDESCGLARSRRVRVEGTSLAKVYRNHVPHSLLYGSLPLRCFCSRSHWEHWAAVAVAFHAVDRGVVRCPLSVGRSVDFRFELLCWAVDDVDRTRLALS